MRSWVIGVVVGVATPALAQPSESIDVRVAPPDRSWYAGHASAPREERPRMFRRSVRRRGLLALGGITRMDEALFGRIDLGVPTPTSPLPQMRTTLATEMRYDVDGSGASTLKTGNVSLTPGVQSSWRLFSLASGELDLVAGVGLMWSRLWVRRPDEPFWPSSWETSTAYAFRIEAGLQYRRHDGLVVALQPSVVLPLNTPEPPDARWMTVEPTKRYTTSLLVGYQFQ